MICPHCHGTSWRAREVDGIRRVERCECWHAEVARQALASAHIPARYRRCGFSTFVTYANEGLMTAVTKAQALAAAFPVVDRGLIFIGPPGIGKTHLAIAVLREVTQKGGRGVYYDTRSLLSTIKSTYNPVTRTSEADILREVMDAELLVLDDLGAERLTDWVEETMHLVVNTRYNERRPTIFTSNYEGVPDGDNLDSLLVRVGRRMYSRLREMCEFLEFSGPDYREFEYPPSARDLARALKSGSHVARPSMPRRASVRARATLKEGQLELGWSGGKAGSN